MKLCFKFMKRQAIPTIIAGTIYLIALLALIVRMNSNSMIYYSIIPYSYASEVVDFFFPLLVTMPFSFYTFFLKKDAYN